MLYSMTGFGRAEQTIGDKNYLVEIRSLNGKQFDLRLTLPALLKPFEFDIRNKLSEGLLRGSVECIIQIKMNGASRPVSINTELAKSYYEPVARLAAELSISTGDILSTILKLPEVIVPTTETLTPEGTLHVAGVRFGLGQTEGGLASAFEVAPHTVVRQRANYEVQFGNTEFSEGARRFGVTTPRLPVDAGLLTFSAAQALTLKGQVLASAPPTARGGQVDISSALDIHPRPNSTSS